VGQEFWEAFTQVVPPILLPYYELLAPDFVNGVQTLDISININIMNSMSTDPVTFAKAIADETRQEIMGHLCCVWLSVNDVVDKLDGKNQPANGQPPPEKVGGG